MVQQLMFVASNPESSGSVVQLEVGELSFDEKDEGDADDGDLNALKGLHEVTKSIVDSSSSRS